MRIIIISDTHIDSIRNLPKVVIFHIKNTDAVIHAGDIVGIKAYEEIKKLNKHLYAVCGNMDILLTGLPQKLTFKLEELTISVTHGDTYANLYNGLVYDFPDSDIVVFGHTHHPYSKTVGKTHLINPGSTSKNRWKNKNSYAILTVEKKNYSFDFYDI